MGKDAFKLILCMVFFQIVLVSLFSLCLTKTSASKGPSQPDRAIRTSTSSELPWSRFGSLDGKGKNPNREQSLRLTDVLRTDGVFNLNTFLDGNLYSPYGLSATATPTPTPCPGPAICGKSCSLDPFGTPIYCSNGQCECAPGYDLQSGVCQPFQPEIIGSESGDYSCPGICPAAVLWATVGSIYKAFDLVPVHGTAPGGEAFLPVWGYQATQCTDHGVAAGASCQGGRNNGATCGSDADCPSGTCAPTRTWAGCAPDPKPFCHGIQDIDEGDFNYSNCDNTEQSDSGLQVQDFTDAWPYLNGSDLCKNNATACFGLGPNCGDSDPSHIDFPDDVIVYHGTIRWESFSGGLVPFEDEDYTMDMESLGHEIYDTDSQYAYHEGCVDATNGRVHVEFDSDDSVDHFTDDDWGAANKWWRDLKSAVGNASNDNDVRCFVKSSVNPGLTCPDNVDADCKWHDPMGVVVGVPSMDCHDNDTAGTDEIHPAFAVAIRIQEDPGSGPEQWAFFYRNQGDNGACGTETYSRCLSTFQLPLGLPVVLAGKVLTGASVDVDWHVWAQDDSTPTDITLDSNFDLLNGTVLNIHLPHDKEGVVGLVTVTPHFDTTPPTITCPMNITTPVDLGKCTAAVTFAPTFSDDCLVSAVCSPPSGSAFPIGTTTDTCTATDQAGLPASCSFNVTVTAGNECPQAQGYWKNHTDLWAVNSLTLGSVTYSKTQLISILNNSTNGDASVILAKALIAALLNLANGSDPVPICNTIADANSLLDGCTVPCATSTNSTTGQAMISDANTLDSYNNGKLTTGCTP